MHLAERAMAGGASSGLMQAFGNAVGSLVAAGTTQADALALSSAVNRVTTVAAGAGVRLPLAQPGDEVLVYNGGANTLIVYPPVGGSINGLSTNTGVSLPASIEARFVKQTGTTVWTMSSGAAGWELTSAESSAGITVDQIDTRYEPGNVARYGMSPSLSDNKAAFDRAVAAANYGGYELVVPPGFYYFTTRPVAIVNKCTIRAAGSKGTVIFFRNYNESTPTNGFLTIAPTAEIASFSLKNVYIYANTGTTGGAALAFWAVSATAPDYSLLDGIVVTGLSGGKWEYALYADGSARATGFRNLIINEGRFFNADTALCYLKSVINTGFTQVGFYQGSGTARNIVITGTSGVTSQNLSWEGGYLEYLDLDYCSHISISVACPTQTITNTANVNYTLLIATRNVSCQTNWDTATCYLATPAKLAVLT